jgi:Restriction endonuclease NotI.
MPHNPYDIICEILGQPAAQMPNPANEHYLCPFKNAVCSKRNHRSDAPFPVCSIFRRAKNTIPATPVIICPKRLYAADIYNDVITHCWPYSKPKHPIIVHEIKMGTVGNVDMVIADLSTDKLDISNFVSIELQAIDTTGSYEPAYTSIVLNSALDKRPTYSFNYKNVQKRLVSQLINKGFYHHHWETKLIAVVQDVIYENIKTSIDFPEVEIANSNIIFMQYQMILGGDDSEHRYELKLKNVTGTTHSHLMMSSLYKIAPPKKDFCARIMKQYQAGQ